MPDHALYAGKAFRIEYAVDANGKSPARDFLEGLSLKDRPKVWSLLKRLGDEGKVANREKCKKLKENLFELKSHQIRILFHYSKRTKRLVVLSHGLIKKKDDLPQREIERAERILAEDEERRRMTMTMRAMEFGPSPQ
jgi:phage-related protein